MSKKILNTVKYEKPKSNTFDLSHELNTSCNMGLLIPVLTCDVVPGDNFRIDCNALVRLQPLVAPMMHRCNIYFHTFFIPNRLLWENWEEWIANTQNPAPPAFPTLIVNNGSYFPLHDYLDVPDPGQTPQVDDEIISAIPFAAYQRVYNEYYRDENLITEVDSELIDGDNSGNADLVVLRRRAWSRGYLTAALPFAQKGQPVQIPIGSPTQDVNVYRDSALVGPTTIATTTGVNPLIVNSPGGGATNLLMANTTALTFDATHINDLRLAFRLQEYLEKSARGGTRYIEHIKVMFGVTSSDARLNRPEFISGSMTPISISEVLQTSESNTTPQGNMAGHGVAVTGGRGGKYFVEEYGYIMTIMSILPVPAYQQGIPKHFTKTVDRTQYLNPLFAHLGEQQIDNREVMAFLATADQNLPFGYIPRFTEYKLMENRVAGQFRNTLNFWTMARIFATSALPVPLNQDFIEADPTFRVFAVTDPLQDHVLVHIGFNIKANRLLPFYGTPSF